ncbi:MAG: HEAT repeat domain-containing protein [Deltaproteobacteria bacterium]|nr:HEAT repeat domain-containing protein [Deltaproteobacteria bacterium]
MDRPSPLLRINPSEDELNAAKKILASLLLACKNLALYPPGHTISKSSINQLQAQLSDFLHKYETLRLEIGREQITSKGGLISEGLPEEGTLHFSLFQVGIRWLEFREGIETDELHDILIILDRYTKLSAEPEGDIVTAFWEKQFPHLRYEVADFSWGEDQTVTEDIFDPTGENAFGIQLGEYRRAEAEVPEDPPIKQSNLSLTPQEQAELKEMIRLEEGTDLTSYLDALLDCLLEDREKENFKEILEVLSGEFTYSLAQRHLAVTLKILEGLRSVLDICKEEMPWAFLSIEEFILNASGQESLASLQEVWKDLNPEDAGVLGQIFQLLDPPVIHTLVPLLLQTQPAPLRQVLIDSIILGASKDMRPLESMFNDSDEMLVEKLVPVIVKLPGGQSLKYLKRLTRHPSSRIRREAVKGLCSRAPARVRDIFTMIDDEDDSIRQLVLNQLGRAREETVENLFLSYLGHSQFGKNEEKHLLQCFRTLGRCGSANSISFLQETLLKRRWIPGSSRSALRRGAALALSELDLPEAELILEKAGRSFYPGLRSLVRKTKKELQHNSTKEANKVVE